MVHNMVDLDLIAEKKSLANYGQKDIERTNPLYDFLFDAALRSFAPYFSKARTLELGAGSGSFTRKLLALSSHVDVVEGSSALCHKIREKNWENLTVIDSLFEEFCPSQTYNNVLASFVNEHVYNPSTVYDIGRQALLSEGYLFVVVPNRQALSRQLALAMGLVESLDSLTEADIRSGHRRTYDTESFLTEIKDNHYEILDHGGLLLKPFADFQLVNWLKAGELTTDHLSGLENLGKSKPELCMALYAITRPTR